MPNHDPWPDRADQLAAVCFLACFVGIVIAVVTIAWWYWV